LNIQKTQYDVKSLEGETTASAKDELVARLTDQGTTLKTAWIPQAIAMSKLLLETGDLEEVKKLCKHSYTGVSVYSVEHMIYAYLDIIKPRFDEGITEIPYSDFGLFKKSVIWSATTGRPAREIYEEMCAKLDADPTMTVGIVCRQYRATTTEEMASLEVVQRKMRDSLKNLSSPLADAQWYATTKKMGARHLEQIRAAIVNLQKAEEKILSVQRAEAILSAKKHRGLPSEGARSVNLGIRKRK
jgi:hypothetical protein